MARCVPPFDPCHGGSNAGTLQGKTNMVLATVAKKCFGEVNGCVNQKYSWVRCVFGVGKTKVSSGQMSCVEEWRLERVDLERDLVHDNEMEKQNIILIIDVLVVCPQVIIHWSGYSNFFTTTWAEDWQECSL